MNRSLTRSRRTGQTLHGAGGAVVRRLVAHVAAVDVDGGAAENGAASLAIRVLYAGRSVER